MNYQFRVQDPFVEKIVYNYSPFGGQEFLSCYLQSRTNFYPPDSFHPKYSENDLLITNLLSSINSFSIISSPSPSLSSFDFQSSISLKELLSSLLIEFVSYNFSLSSFWLNKIVQRFEVSKKLFSFYQPGFKKGYGDIDELSLYVSFGLALSFHSISTNSLQSLSTLLKLNDFMLSFYANLNDVQLSFKNPLDLMICSELFLVNALACSHDVVLNHE